MLQAIELTKKYGDQVALNSLNLKVEPGEVFCLLGQNGAGKTTTINLFLGFTGVSSGKALVKGGLVSPDQPETKKFLAYIPEVVMLYANLTSLENLDFFSRIAGFNYKKEELEKYLLQAGLQPEAFHKRVGNYSKGMRQKVGIAIAVAKNAEVILMDEPTSGLDPKATHEFSEIVKQLSKDGRTIFMATHDIFNAVNVGTRIGIMRQGSLIHTLNANDISAHDLQQLYLETI
ncbi:ABC-2 type transport system ATP-binding protein [Pedobacter cryoconitis]|uniref:ABC-2 type transport system ATP-binding protein n=1 Tax=Pedobacter cryoconitis TaxID=188932 RepID=A0A7W8YVS8_9SPHI|nr:ABC transporter ATP-binding protein [Pedobacter cryoconitis]MBB5622664.1 ABC-2 type transport system ATP-binding protein [Pedobacter cryoconitis]